MTSSAIHVAHKAAILTTAARLAVAVVLLPLAANAAKPVAKPDKVVVCAACHGETGKAVLPIYPNLAGQYPDYLQQALQAYKTGTRKNPIMSAQAAGLTDADIKQLAAWFAQQKPVLYTPEANPSK